MNNIKIKNAKPDLTKAKIEEQNQKETPSSKDISEKDVRSNAIRHVFQEPSEFTAIRGYN